MPESGANAHFAALTSRLRAALDQVPALVMVLRGPDLIVEFANARRAVLSDGADIVGRPLGDVLAAPDFARIGEQLRDVLETGEPHYELEARAVLPGTGGATYWDYALIPVGDPAARPRTGVAIHAVDVTRLVAARAQATEFEHRFTTLFDANVIGVTVSDEHRVLEANDAFLAMIGRTRADLAAGLSWQEITDDLSADEVALQQLRERGAAPPYEKEYVRPDGTRMRVLISGSRLQSDPLRILATAFDLSERATLLEREREARFAAELAGARMSRLQEITASLSAARTADEIARTVVHHALEALGASAAMLVDANREIARAVGFKPDAVEQWRRFPALLPASLEAVVGTGRAVVAEDPQAVAATAPQLLADGWGAAIAIPVEVGGRTLGGLLLTFRDARTLVDADRAFLASLGRQAAAALERAELYENRRFVAGKLQEGLLPRHLAEVPGAEAAVVYESISGGGEVGGDFYDLFDTGRDSWALAVGDVSGKGTAAAVVTGLARHTLRAIARVMDEPREVLAFLNGALLRHDGPPAFCTVACAIVRPAAGGGFGVRVSSGGHPFPLVLRASGELETIEVTGTMLGVADDPQLELADLVLAPGDALLLYTDGVLDARADGGERFGAARLREAVLGATGGSADAIAGAVEAAVRAFNPGASADDRAIVVLRAL